MKDGFLKAAAAAPKIRVADPAWNALEICKALDSCYAQRAKLIVLPELCLTGYTCQDLFLQERLLEESLEGLQAVLEHTKGHDALTFVGLPLEKDGKLTMWQQQCRTAGSWGLSRSRIFQTMGNFMRCGILRQAAGKCPRWMCWDRPYPLAEICCFPAGI